MGDVEHCKIRGVYLPPSFLRRCDGAALNVENIWRILRKGASRGGFVTDTCMKPKPSGETSYASWQGGGLFVQNDEPQGRQVLCQMHECKPQVVRAMRACLKEARLGKLFSANITADDPNEMIAQGQYILFQFGALSESRSWLVDGYVAGGTAVTCARSNFPQEFPH